MERQPRRKLMMTAREWEEADLDGTLPYTAERPDFSILDDSDATRDKEGRTLRDRKYQEYVDARNRHFG